MNTSEIKLNIFSAMHRIIGRAFHLEDAMEGLTGVIAEALPLSTAAIVVRGDEFRFFVTPSLDPKNDSEQMIRKLCRTGGARLFQTPQPFVALRDNTFPLFLDRKAVHSIQKEQVRMVGCPVTLNDELVGLVIAGNLFGSRVPLVEDIGLLSMLADFIAQILSLEMQATRREETLRRENLALKTRISEEQLGLICPGSSPAARKLEGEIRKAARTGAPVLIWGEPGAGKSYIAGLIHQLSARAAFPLVKVHCGLPEDILAKEMFGVSNENGLAGSKNLTFIERAAGGALLLDEVDELLPSHQIKLLNILDDPNPANFSPACPNEHFPRLISTAGSDLSEAAASASFRGDLLGRLNTLLIHAPSIRERKDAEALATHFFADACTQHGRAGQLDAHALKRLSEYDWPGNMAEMRKAMVRLAIMADGERIRARDVESVLNPGRAEIPGAEEITGVCAFSRLDKIERRELSAALERNQWIRRRAAEDLGLTFRQMNYRVKKFGLDGLIRQNRTISRD